MILQGSLSRLSPTSGWEWRRNAKVWQVFFDRQTSWLRIFWGTQISDQLMPYVSPSKIPILWRLWLQIWFISADDPEDSALNSSRTGETLADVQMEYLNLHQHFSNGLSFEASEGSVIIWRVWVCSDTKEGHFIDKKGNDLMLLKCQTNTSNSQAWKRLILLLLLNQN